MDKEMKSIQTFDNLDRMSNKKMVQNENLDFFKFICSILVIMIHVNLFAEENKQLNFIFVQVLPRIAVPFFFMVSGYFFKKGIEKRTNNDERKKYFYEKIKRLIKMYIQVSALYIPVIVIETIGKEITITTILHYISSFFIEGIYYHLWFLIALIYYTIFYFKTEKHQKLLYIVSIMSYIIGVILHSYSFIFKDFIVFKWIFEDQCIYDNFRRIITYGFPFYILGTQIYIWKNRINKKVINLQIIISIVLFLIEVVSLYIYSQSKSYTITVFLYPMCYFVFCKLLILPTEKSNRIKWGKLATLIYFLHPLVIKIVTGVFKIIKIKIPSVITYILVTFITLMISFILLKFLIKERKRE